MHAQFDKHVYVGHTPYHKLVKSSRSN